MKMGLGHQPVPNNIFANDQHKPSVRLPEVEKPEAGTSDRDVTAPPEAPIVSNPNSGAGRSKTRSPTPASPDPPEEGSRAWGSEFPSPDSEVLELEEEEDPTSNTTEV